MNSVERMEAVLSHKIPDRVPCFEWIVDKKVVNALLPSAAGEATEEDFINEFGLDVVCVDPNYFSEKLPSGYVQDEWGMIKGYSSEAHSYPVDGPIHNAQELEKYTPPSATAPGRFDTLKKKLEKYADGSKAVMLHLNDIWSIPSRMMPFEEFIINIFDEPEFISELVGMTVDVNIALATEAAKLGCKFVYTGDDVAYNNGPMIAPSMFEEIFVPHLKRVIGAYKDLGLYVIKHTDGNVMSLLDYYIDAGIDCFDPIDPIAGMDFGFLKEKYGKTLAFKGNVNCATTLVSGSIEDVIEESRSRMAIGKPGGGYIFSSSNSIHSSVNPQNYKAMLETWKELRDY